MKANYFNQHSADGDDIALKAMIAQGLVPQKCLLGGALATLKIRSGGDPCADCPGPRARCEGRPFGGAVPRNIVSKYKTDRGAQQFFFLGVDSAPSESQRSDDGALVGGAATPKYIPDPVNGRTMALSSNIADWNFDFVYANRLTAQERASARQYSGVIHRLHQRFRFERMVVDPGGGGIWVQRELKNHKQIINGVETEVRPIGDQVNAPHELMGVGDFILHLYKRGDPGIELLWPHLSGDDQLNDAAYSIIKEGFDSNIISIIAPAAYWYGERAEEVKRWDAERQWCIKNLNAMVEQLARITVQTNELGEQMFTKRNARIFEARGKKDLASAAMYCYLAFLIWLRAEDWSSAIPENDKKMFAAW